MLKVRSSLIVLTLLMVLFLAACGGGEAAAPEQPENAEESSSDEDADTVSTAEETAEVSLWVFEGEEAFLPRLEEEFEAQNPNIDLQITEIPEGEYVTKIDTALAAGEPPEIGFIYEARWVKADKVLSAKSALEAAGVNLEDFNQGALGANCLLDNDVFCMGTYSGGMVLFY